MVNITTMLSRVHSTINIPYQLSHRAGANYGLLRVNAFIMTVLPCHVCVRACENNCQQISRNVHKQ